MKEPERKRTAVLGLNPLVIPAILGITSACVPWRLTGKSLPFGAERNTIDLRGKEKKSGPPVPCTGAGGLSFVLYLERAKIFLEDQSRVRI